MKVFVSLAGIWAAAQADPHYGYGGIAHHPTGISYSNRSPQGAYGKRDADADAYGYGYGRGIAAHPTGISYSNRSPQGAYGKRDADADAYGYGYGRGIAAHPTGISYSNRSPQGAYGKRDADADALGLGAGGFIRQSRPGLPVFGLHHNGVGAFAHPVGKRDADADAYGYGYGRGIAGHWGGGISYSNRSPQGAYGKRDADADAYGYGYGRGIAGHWGGGISYSNRSPQGAYGKRDADADALGLGAGGFIRQARPGLAVFGLHHNGVGAFAHPVGKRDADADAYGYGYGRGIAGHWGGGISYSNRSPQGAYGKRDADADALGLGSGGFIRQSRPYAAFGIHHNGYGAFAHPVGKRSADALGYGRGIAGHWGGGISYSNRSPQGLGAYWG